jgi:hypothetical protein
MWATCKRWFEQYIWRFQIGKAGTALVAIGFFLDLYHKAETLYKWIEEIPAVVGLVHGWWFDPAIIVVGLGFIYWSTRKAKHEPPPKTLDERVAEAEQDILGTKAATKAHGVQIDMLISQATAIIKSQIEMMKIEGKALELSEDEIAMIQDYRRFRLRLRKAPIVTGTKAESRQWFQWRASIPEGVELVQDTAEIILPSEAR